MNIGKFFDDHGITILTLLLAIGIVVGLGLLAVWANKKPKPEPFIYYGAGVGGDANNYGSISWNSLCDPLAADCSNKPNWGNGQNRQYQYSIVTMQGKVLQSGIVQWNNPSPGFAINPSSPLQPGQQYKAIVVASTSLGQKSNSATFSYQPPVPTISGIVLSNADAQGQTDFDFANPSAQLAVSFDPRQQYGAITGSSGGFFINGTQSSGQNFSCGNEVQDNKLECKFDVRMQNMYGGTKYVPWVNITTAAGPTGLHKSTHTYTQSSDLPGAPANLTYTPPSQ